MSKNVCQYWVDEPVRCTHWDVENNVCIYTPDAGSADQSPANRYPDCNAIGTDATCNKYTGGDLTSFRCILPDTMRHIGQRFIDGGGKWGIDDINEYNDGQCDGVGTSATCSGYSPYHMAFSSIQPDKYPYAADLTQFDTVPSGLVFRLPLYYDVSYVRSQLSRCYWWKDDPQQFSIDATTGRIEPLPYKCTNTYDEKIAEYWTNHSYDKDLGMWKAPCNGCKPECPGYTGVCWQYCIDPKMSQGDKVLAEQILELRYYLFKESWDAAEYKDSFAEPDIQAWAGQIHQKFSDQRLNEIRWIIDSWRVYIPDFEYFNTAREKIPLTAGTPANNYDGDYPDLIKELKSIPLKPIIRNKFETIEYDDGDINVFESSDMAHEEVVILGDTFWYGSSVYAINLSDPDLSFLPKDVLLEYSSMFEIEKAWENSSDKFEEFYSNLNKDLEFIIKAMPEKIFSSEIASDTNTFYIGAKTFWGDNDIVVFDKGSGVWEYDHTYFKKLFVGGVIAQTSFKLTGEGTTDYLPSYQDNFMAYSNDNGEITFNFFSLTSEWFGDSAELAYLYNDAVRIRLPSNPANPSLTDSYVVNYKLYKITFGDGMQLTIPNGELSVLGNAGYILVTITDADKALSNAIKPWEIDDSIYLYYSDDERIEMVVHEKATDRLEVNQFIIKPKNISEFKQVCNDTYLYIDKLYFYEKHSFGEEPRQTYWGAEVVSDEYVGEDDSVTYRDDIAKLSGSSDGYTLTKFGYDPLIISGVLRGLSGRIKGQIKTKLITWVRQPYCRDVEIYYTWSASYKKYKLLPEYNCYGNIDVEYEVDENGAPISVGNTYIPPCGDHDLSFFSETGPMWYPYDTCDDLARYNIVGNLTEFDIRIMEPFWEDVDPPHGNWDIRMLGPANNFGYTCDTHPHLWDCLCDWSFCNEEKSGNNRFSGYANYRGGMDYLAKERALRSDGSLPKFGNTYRDFIRSYRSIDNIDYYIYDELAQQFTRKNKWVPANEFYTVANLGASTQDYPYLMYCSNDFYDDKSFFMNPFGLYRASNTIENVSVQEKIDEDDGVPIRHRFEDVFLPHDSLAGLYYPYPKNPYQRMVGGIPTNIITWYTYKDYPGDSSKSIQWAWQEIWKPIERYDVVHDTTRNTYYMGNHLILKSGYEHFDEWVDSNYEEQDQGSAKGRHLFLNITYPEYKYDFRLGEHRLVCDEGDQVVSILPPEKSEPGVFSTDYWTIKLNDGPARCFDSSGVWSDATGCSGVLYDTCTQSPWVEDITLFDTGYTDVDTDPDRTIQTYDDAGDVVYEYYQRGLNVSIDSSRLYLLPSKMVVLSYDEYNIRVNKSPDCMDVDDPNPWSVVNSNEWYPSLGNCYFMEYCCGAPDAGNTVSMDFKFNDDKTRVISGVVISFKYGASEVSDGTPDINGLKYLGYLYHLPGLTMYKSTNGTDWTEVYNLDSVYPSTRVDTYTSKTGFYDIEIPASELINGYSYFRINFRLTPTTEEIESRGDLKEYYDVVGVVNMVGIDCVKLYFGDLIEADEDLVTYERKYNISYGSHGDFPPHGTESTGSLLYPVPTDRSTVYQYDSVAGVVGMPGSSGKVNSINKIRGRLMNECHADKERVAGFDVYKFESEQKKIHDEIAISKGDTSITMVSVTPPSLEDFLNEMGMSFPTWSCTFINTVVRPLSPIIDREAYSPCGHKFDWNFETMHLQHGCGKHGSVFWRSTENVFEYVFRHECGEYQQDMMDVLISFFKGVGNLLLNPMAFNNADAARADRFNQYYSTYRSQGGSSTMSSPGPIDPLN